MTGRTTGWLRRMGGINREEELSFWIRGILWMPHRRRLQEVLHLPRQLPSRLPR